MDNGITLKQDVKWPEHGDIVLDFARSWGAKMQEAIRRGNKLADVAESLQAEAVGFSSMTSITIGLAILLLYPDWIYGDELRAWHMAEYENGANGIDWEMPNFLAADLPFDTERHAAAA